MSRRFKAICFDKDGTLFDFAHTWEAWAQSFLQRLSKDDVHAATMGAAIGFDTQAARFHPSSIVIAGTPFEVAQALHPQLSGMTLTEVSDLLNEEASKAPQHEAVPLQPLLSQLRSEGYVLGVATNDAEAPALAHLKGAGILEFFDFVAGCDSGHGGKPAPGQLFAFAKAVKCAPQTCVMVGDSLHDLGAGRSAGFATVGVLTGFASRDDLADMADIVMDDISGLPSWLGKPS